MRPCHYRQAGKARPSTEVVTVNGMPLTTETAESSKQAAGEQPEGGALRTRAPRPADGSAMWRLARDSGTLDLNSSYAYLLFARHFAATSRVAEIDGEPAGFVIGYLRPDAPDRLLIWQIAVAEHARGHGLAGALLDELFDSLEGARHMETTITPGNTASRRLFESFAERRGASITSSPWLEEQDFPDEHESESLYVISDVG